MGIAAPGPIAETVGTPSLVPPRSVRLKLFPYFGHIAKPTRSNEQFE
jgi:hypothetical protein